MLNKKNKILVIGATDKVGGAARVGWDIGSELIRKGFDVKYLVAYKTAKDPNVSELKKPWFLKRSDSYTKINTTALFRKAMSFFLANDIDFGAEEEILNHPWYKEADIIQLHNIHGNFLKLEVLEKIDKEKKIVWTLHDMWAITGKCVYTENPKIWNSRYSICRRLGSQPAMLWDNTKYLWNKKKGIYKNLDRLTVVTPSMWLYNIVEKSILGNAKKLLIHNGVDTTIFHPSGKDAIRKKLGLPTNKKIIIFVAQAGISDPRKGWRYIEEAVKKFKNNKEVIFLCVGGGRKKNVVKNIIFVPFLKNKKELSEYYSAADVLLFTSLAENCPLVVLEALSCGIPVVSFNEGGVPELITHKRNGYLAEYKNLKDLISGLKYILNLNKSSYQKMEKENIDLARAKFSLKNMTEGYYKLYKSLIYNK